MKNLFKPLNVSAAILAVALLAGACRKDLPESSAPVSADPSLLQALKDVGLKPSAIKDLGKYYLVEGDMLFVKNQTDVAAVKAYFAVGRSATGKETGNESISQWRTNGTISSDNVENIKVNTYVSSAFTNQVRQAVYNWRDIASCKVDFYDNWSINSSSPNSITFIVSSASADPELNGYYALGEFPSSQNAGFRVRINGPAMSALSSSQQVFVLTHEIGHCLSFRHTDWQSYWYEYNSPFGAVQVAGTPQTDGSSIMNSGSGTVPSWSTFPYYDALAAQTIYPYQPYDQWINDSSLPYTLYDDLVFTLQWNSSLVSTSTVSIEIFQYGVSKGILASNIPNTGSYPLYIFGNLTTPSGVGFHEVQLKIIADDNPSISDVSKLFYCQVD